MKKNLVSLVTLGLLVGACFLCGFLLGQKNPESSPQTVNEIADSSLQQAIENAKVSDQYPELKKVLMKADTAAAGRKIAMATASIDGDVDVLFSLDFESGNLFAWLPGTNGTFIGQWQANVSTAIGLEKGANPDLLLSVANFNVRVGNTGNEKTAPLIVYVANGENGRVAGYVFRWNPQTARRGVEQGGPLVAAYEGTTRQQTIKRD